MNEGFSPKDRDKLSSLLEVYDESAELAIGRRPVLVLIAYDQRTGGVMVLSNVDGPTAQTIIESSVEPVKAQIRKGAH